MANELAASKPAPLILTKEETTALRNLVRKAFSDRLDHEQRKKLVESFTECEGENERPQYGPVAEFRLQVALLSDDLRDTLGSRLSAALAEYCGRRR